MAAQLGGQLGRISGLLSGDPVQGPLTRAQKFNQTPLVKLLSPG